MTAAAEIFALIDASPAQGIYLEPLRVAPFDTFRGVMDMCRAGQLSLERVGKGFDFIATRPKPERQGWFWVPPYREHTQHHYSTGRGFLCGRKRPAGRPTFDPHVRGDLDFCCPACLAARANQFAAILPAAYPSPLS